MLETMRIVGLASPTSSTLSSSVRLELDRDRSRLESLQQLESTSSRLSSSMSHVLVSFESRLAGIERTVLPVYNETEKLRRRQENIEETLDKLDEVINYYNVAQEVMESIKSGPNLDEENGVDNYILAMDKLRAALDYFRRHKSRSVEVQNVSGLYETGGDCIAQFTADLMKRSSQPIDSGTLVRTLNDPQSKISLSRMDEKVELALKSLITWLMENERDACLNIWANARAYVVKRSIELLLEHVRSSATSLMLSPPLSSMGRKLSASPLDSSSPNTKKVSRIQSSLRHNFSSLVTKGKSGSSTNATTATTSTNTSAPITATTVNNAEMDLHFKEVEALCLATTALHKLALSEQALVTSLIATNYQRRTIEKILKGGLEVVGELSDAIIAKIRVYVQNNDFLTMVILFYIIRHLRKETDQLEETSLVRSRLNGLLVNFLNAGSSSLNAFIDSIKMDSTNRDRLPRDGTVFQLASTTFFFLEHVVDHMATVSACLSQESSYNQSLLRVPSQIDVNMRKKALFGIMVKRVLVQLNLTLINKSEGYTDHFLRAIFRLNNYQYILTSLQRSPLLELLLLADPDVESNYSEMILEQKRLYSQSWSKVLQVIWSASDDLPQALLQAPGKLSERHCRLIKEKFVVFNKELEELCNCQRSYCIPEVELRESLKRDNKEYILPKYTAFYDKYAAVAFTRNPEKYIKYTPADVANMIEGFFDAAA